MTMYMNMNEYEYEHEYEMTVAFLLHFESNQTLFFKLFFVRERVISSRC